MKVNCIFHVRPIPTYDSFLKLEPPRPTTEHKQKYHSRTFHGVEQVFLNLLCVQQYRGCSLCWTSIKLRAVTLHRAVAVCLTLHKLEMAISVSTVSQLTYHLKMQSGLKLLKKS